MCIRDRYRMDEIRPGTIVCLHTEKNLPTSLNVSVLNPTQFIYLFLFQLDSETRPQGMIYLFQFAEYEHQTHSEF